MSLNLLKRRKAMRIRGIEVAPASKVRADMARYITLAKDVPIALTKHGNVVCYVISPTLFDQLEQQQRKTST